MKKNVIKKQFRKLHKYIGFVFSIFILHLTVTGILLLYPESLGVEKKFMNNSYFLKKYNMSTKADVLMADTDKHEIVVINKSFYINNEFIDTLDSNVISLYFKDADMKLYIFSAFEIQIYFFEEVDQKLELLNIETLVINNKIVKVGTINKNIILATEKDYYKITADKISLFYGDKKKITWLKIKMTPENIAKHYLKLHQGEGVSFHRIVTELHSGKFFGVGAIFLLLLSSISIIFLVVSSFVFGINYKRKKK